MKKSNVNKPMCNFTWAFLSKNDVQFFLLIFSPFWGENTWVPLLIFLPPHPTKHTSKSFPFHFLSKVFHPLYFTSKQTHPKFLPLIFLSILERKHFGGLREKTPRPQQFFSLPSLQPNTHQKSFPSHFLSKVFHPPHFTSKQTHSKLKGKKLLNCCKTNHTVWY